MKHLPRILLVMFLLTSLSSFANSINFSDLNINLYIGPNYGFGDNVFGAITGLGVNVLAGGGTPDYWFNGDQGFSPGSSGGGDVSIYFDFAQGTLGSQTYSGEQLGINSAVLYTGSFTFPTNGRFFSVQLPASIGLITAVGCNSSGVCQNYRLTTKPGKLTLSFFYLPQDGLYYGYQGSFVTSPEPGTLGLVAIGMGALAWLRRKQKMHLKRTLPTLSLG
jgi:hypothetical protein